VLAGGTGGTGGTGRVPRFTYDATGEVIGAFLERISGKRVIVPDKGRQTRFEGKVVGDVRAVADRLGFTVKGKTSARQGTQIADG
jgi:hypothetical protein